jgi:TIR domain
MPEAVREIFLSYAGADRERVAPLVHPLEEDGLRIWWDQEICDGQICHRAIEQALTRAPCVVVVWSRESIRSEWVINEACRRGSSGFRSSRSTQAQPAMSAPWDPYSSITATPAKRGECPLSNHRQSTNPSRRRFRYSPLRDPLRGPARKARAGRELGDLFRERDRSV